MVKMDANSASFDFAKLSGRDMQELAAAEKAVNVEVMAKILAKVVISVPGMTAAPTAEAIMDLPFVTIMGLLKAMGKALAGELQG